MKSTFARMASSLALIAVISVAAYGSASAATTISGTLNFGSDSTNYYDPANLFVPAGYGNFAGLPVTVGAGVEFGFDDGLNLITADFTFTSLVITNVTGPDTGGAAAWTQTFKAGTAGLFDGLTLINDTFLKGVTYGLVGDTLTVSWVGTDLEDITGAVTFAFNGPSEVPLPAALPLFATILASGGLIAWRRKRKAAAAARTV